MSNPHLNESNGSGQFRSKSEQQRRFINEALEFLSLCGIPLEKETVRGVEYIALCFLSVADVLPDSGWASAKTQVSGRVMKTRDIIAYLNKNYGENISLGSYDDIRRRYLKWLVMAELVVPTSPNSARNSPSRGYALSDELGAIVRQIGTVDYRDKLATFLHGRETLRSILAQPRDLPLLSVTLANGNELNFSPGEHNELQIAIIHSFLKRFGYDAEVLYVGDAADKNLYLDADALEALNFFRLDHGELPDVVAYSKLKN